MLFCGVNLQPKVDQIVIYLETLLFSRILYWTFVCVAKATTTPVSVAIFSFNHKLCIDLAGSLTQKA